MQKSTRNFLHGLDFGLLTPQKIDNFVDPLKPRSLAYYDCDSKLMLLGKYSNRARILWGGYRIEDREVSEVEVEWWTQWVEYISEGASIFPRILQKIQRKLSQHQNTELDFLEITACGKEYLPNLLENW